MLSYLNLFPVSAIKGKSTQQKLEKIDGESHIPPHQSPCACNSVLIPDGSTSGDGSGQQMSSLFCELHPVMILEHDSCCNILHAGLEQFCSWGG